MSDMPISKFIPIHLIDISDPKNFDKKDHPQDGILIFSDEWRDRKEQCQNYINIKNGIFDRKIHGRKCEVKIIDKITGRDFIEKYHIQGSNTLGVIFFGLFYQDELVSVMSLGRHNRQLVENKIVLDRYCVKEGVIVQGGANKLFNKCIEWAKEKKYDEIISFSDNRWSCGQIYDTLKFKLEINYKPDYCYIDSNNITCRIGKQNQKKSLSKCPEGMTEFQWAEFRGYKKLWDRGKKRWIYSLNESRLSWKEKLSNNTAIKHSDGFFHHCHIRGYFKSLKNNKDIYYSSSYELRCLYLLDNDDTVFSFKRGESFINENKKSRSPDIHVEYKNGIIEIIEVKPKKRLEEIEIQQQIQDTKDYCLKNNYKFRIWTEVDSGLNTEYHIIIWAKQYIDKLNNNFNLIENQKKNHCTRQKKYYEKKLKNNKIKITCSYCNGIIHEIRTDQYNANIKKNGRYICHNENAHKSKPNKNKKINPYALEGKKQCVGLECQKILSFENFSKDKTRSDGYKELCKECYSKKQKENYLKRKNKK